MKINSRIILCTTALLSALVICQSAFADAPEMHVTSTKGIDHSSTSGNETTFYTENISGITAEVKTDILVIPAGATLNNYFAANGQTILYTVKPQNVTVINGMIKVASNSPYTGNVMISNANGVLIGHGASINVNSFLVTSLGTKESDITRNAGGYITDILFKERHTTVFAPGPIDMTYGVKIDGADITTKENFTALGPLVRISNTTINAGKSVNVLAAKEVKYNIASNTLSNIVKSLQKTERVLLPVSITNVGGEYDSVSESAIVGLNDKIDIQNSTINAGGDIKLQAYFNLATPNGINISSSNLTANAALANAKGEIFVYSENGNASGSAVAVNNNSTLTANITGSGDGVHVNATQVTNDPTSEIKTINNPEPTKTNSTTTNPSDDVAKVTLTASTTTPSLGATSNSAVISANNLVPFGAAAKMKKSKKNKFVCEENKDVRTNYQILETLESN